jgi:hypothetical protein
MGTMNQLSIVRAREQSAAQTKTNCDWPMTSCYIDAWASVLAGWGLDPVAALGVCVTQDYEVDQFTFIKYRPDDVELLYGAIVSELSVYSSLEDQIAEQVGDERIVLVEVDAYYLPDTRATTYHSQHTKTTIGIDAIDVADGWLRYFHNAGQYLLAGEDYAGVLRKPYRQQPADHALPPYVEFIKRRWPPLADGVLAEAAMGLLRHHLKRCPANNPIRRYRQYFPRHMDGLITQPEGFHDYAFNNFRQLGANFELLAAHVDWLRARDAGITTAISDAARNLSATAKIMQFKVARVAKHRRHDACDALFDSLERDYELVVEGLDRVFN